MNKKWIALLIFCFATNLAFSQSARSILDNASEAYAKSDGVTAKFTLNTKEVGTKQTYSQDGTAHMKGNKFKIEIPSAITWFDGKTQWIYVKDTEEVNVSNPTDAELQTIIPSLLFSIYKEGYDLKYNGEKNIKGKVVQEVEMTAQNKKSEPQKMIIQINKANSTFAKIILYDASGMENTLIINSYQKNSTLTDASFSFSKKEYPNTEIVDLR